MNRYTSLAAGSLTGLTAFEPTPASAREMQPPSFSLVGTWRAITTFYGSRRPPERSSLTFVSGGEQDYGLLTVAIDGVAIPCHGWWRRSDGMIGFSFLEPLTEAGGIHLIAVTHEVSTWTRDHFVSHGGGAAYGWPTSLAATPLPVLAVGLTTITARRVQEE